MGRPEERIEVLGVGVDPLTVDDLNAKIGREIRAGGHALVLNANVHCLNLAYKDYALRSFLNGAEVVFCDGSGVMLAARLLGRRIPERITYADWAWRLADYAASEGLTLYLLGARPGVAKKAAENLKERHPDLRIPGIHHGHFDLSTDSPENETVIEKINAVAPDILLVGFGMPIQERWLMENWSRIDARVALTGGAVFDYISGELRRGPRILTDNGFEWLARLLVEPRRLWQRYILGNPVFLWRVIRQLIGEHRLV